MNKNKSLFKYIQPTLISVIVFISLTSAVIYYTNYKKILWEKDVRAEMLSFIIGKKSNLEKALYSRIYYTRGVAAYIGLNPQISNNEFALLAKEYIQNDSVISSLALSKDCIINAIYPLEGHEAALGLNLLDHPERKEIVEKTIETHQTFVAGPVELIEGGIAFISYTPIFDRKKNKQNNFWGVTDIVIKQNNLFSEANLNCSESGYNFALKGYNGNGNDGKVFWGDENIFNNNPVITQVELPIGNWVLASVPENGWDAYRDQDKAISYILFISVLIISFLIWLFTKTLIRVKNSEKELKAVFDSMDSLIIEFNIEGDYVKINSTNEDLLFLPKGELEGKNLSNIFEEGKANFFIEALRNCIHNKKLVVIEYPLQINGEERWFIARLSYKSENTAIFNSNEITERKKQEKLLVESEKKLKELNEVKNKFFSIIAHDLRGPLGTHKTIISLVLDEYDKLDETTRKDLIINLQDSSENLYTLLENLLKWSLSQSEKIRINKQNFALNEKIDIVLNYFERGAQLKNIQLVNEINKKKVVFADVNLSETIFRNLISNAIKFSNSGDKIRVYSEQMSLNGKEYFTISVADTGVGIQPNRLKSLFSLDKAQSLHGTANESGSGLGLLLCKEFAELQGGKIKVTSTHNIGSIFTLVLPII